MKKPKRYYLNVFYGDIQETLYSEMEPFERSNGVWVIKQNGELILIIQWDSQLRFWGAYKMIQMNRAEVKGAKYNGYTHSSHEIKKTPLARLQEQAEVRLSKKELKAQKS